MDVAPPAVFASFIDCSRALAVRAWSLRAVHSLFEFALPALSLSPLSLSFARRTKRRPSGPYASAVKIARPLESIWDEQPQEKPDLLSFCAMATQSFTRSLPLLLSTPRRQSDMKRLRNLTQHGA